MGGRGGAYFRYEKTPMSRKNLVPLYLDHDESSQSCLPSSIRPGIGFFTCQDRELNRASFYCRTIPFAVRSSTSPRSGSSW